MNHIPVGASSTDLSGGQPTNFDAAMGAGSSPPRSKMAASGARNIVSASLESQRAQADLDDSYAIDSYTIQPLAADHFASASSFGSGSSKSNISSGTGVGTGTGNTGTDTGGGRRGRRPHPMGTSASTPGFANSDYDVTVTAADGAGSSNNRSSGANAPTAAELRKRHLELEVKRLELELLGKENEDADSADIMFIDGDGGSGENSSAATNKNKDKDASKSSASADGGSKNINNNSGSNGSSGTSGGEADDKDKSRQSLEEALAIMQMQNKMLAKRIEQNEMDARQALEEEVERRTKAALDAAERKAEVEKKEIMELERGKRLLMISQIEDEAAAKLSREQEDREVLEEERFKLQGKLKQMELAEKRHEQEQLESQLQREEERRQREREQEQREQAMREELEENKRKLMAEIVSSEQEKAKVSMQAQIERLEQEYQASMEAQRENMRQDQEAKEQEAHKKLEEETSRVRTELSSQYEKENARVLQLQERTQRELELEREEMRRAAKRMEQEKEQLLQHMRQSEEKAQEELVLAELTKSEYVSNMQRMEKEQKNLQMKMKELDVSAQESIATQSAVAKATADRADSADEAGTQDLVAQQVAAALAEERIKLESAFKELEDQKLKMAQSLSETEEETKKNQEQLAAQIAQEKAELDAKLKQMSVEKEEMTSHLAMTLKESQSQTRVIQEKMEAEKEELVRLMEQREQEKLEVLLKLQQTQMQMEVEKIERALLQRAKEEYLTAEAGAKDPVASAAAPEDTAKETKGGSDADGKCAKDAKDVTDTKDAAEEKNSVSAESKEADTIAGDAAAKETGVPGTAGKLVPVPPTTSMPSFVVQASEAKLAEIDDQAAAHKVAADSLAKEREQLRLQLQQFAKEKEDLVSQLALAERTAKARHDLAAQHANREKEELKAAVQRMREELRLEKEAAAAAAKQAAADGHGSSSERNLGGELSGSSESDAEQLQTLKPSRSLFNMFEDNNSGNDPPPMQLPRTLSKVLVQAMPHTIEVIPEGEEGAMDVFGIDSDEESQALSRHGSGASLGSRIRREKHAADMKTQAVAKEVAAAKQAAAETKGDGSPAPAPAPVAAPAAPVVNPFDDLPAPHAAAASGDLTRLKVLGKLETSLLASFDGAQRSPLFYAVAYGQEDITAFLVENAPDMVDSVDSHGDTPVHAAASGGNVECLRTLLSCKEMRSKERARKAWEKEMQTAGKDISAEAFGSYYGKTKDPEVADTRNSMKMTPSHLARTPEILELLYSYGADMSAVDANGRSPLFVSCAMNRESLTEYIIQCLDRECKTEELYEKDNRGDTPLHAAACNGSVECLLQLLQFGVDPTVSNTKGLKAIDLAARNNQTKCRNLLAEYHLHFCTSSEFDSVLFLATLEGHRQVKANETPGQDGSYEIIKKKASFSGAGNASFGGGGGGGLKHVQSMFSLKTNKSLRLQRWGEWIAYEDQQTEKVYWYNSSTSKGQWEKPQVVAKMQTDATGSSPNKQLTSKKSMRLKKYGDWIEYVTDTSQTFFYNEKNGEFQWHAPPGHPKYKADASSGTSPDKSVAQAMLGDVNVTTGSNIGEGENSTDPDATHGNGKGGGENSEWQPYKDPDSGSIFWYNTVTHVSQWDCPFDDVDFTGQKGGDGGDEDGKHDSDDDDVLEVLDDDDLGI